jgi:hypothetical protein
MTRRNRGLDRQFAANREKMDRLGSFFVVKPPCPGAVHQHPNLTQSRIGIVPGES